GAGAADTVGVVPLVHFPTARWPRWVDNFTASHGATDLVVAEGELRGTAEDGSSFEARLPFGTSYDGPAEAAALASGQAMVSALKRSEAELEQRVRERTFELARANERLSESAAKHRRQATHDALTGLANRMLLDDRLDRSVEHARRWGTKVGLVMIDLDHFKPVNDTYGRAVGDRLLVAAAARLREAVRTSDTVARYGGDEFVLVIENVHNREDVERAVASVHARLSLPVMDGDLKLSFAASIGIGIYPDDALDASTLLRRADEAMYAAKKIRKTKVECGRRRSVEIAA
ncbi:MAG: diguanylate cyclase domain-containing protein, partial [Burkholderiaceae bacterium]